MIFFFLQEMLGENNSSMEILNYPDTEWNYGDFPGFGTIANDDTIDTTITNV